MSERAFEGLRTVAVNGVSLAYREQGEGEPVLFVHGSASDLRTWEHQLPAIAASYHAVVYSRRYARPNDEIQEGSDDPMLPHVDDLVAFVRSIDASPVHLVGHSWGGFVCLLAAIRHPQVVRSLVLMEPPVLSLFVSTPPRPTELFRTFVRRPRTALAILNFGISAAAPAQKAYARGDDEAALEAFGRGVLGNDAFEQLSPARKEQVRDNLAVDKAQLLGAGFPALSDDEVSSVGVPTLLMNGRRSPAFLQLLSNRLEELLPNVERVEVPEASHLMHEDNPSVVNDAILTFLRRQ